MTVYAELKKCGIEYVRISTLNTYCQEYENEIELLRAENSRLRRKLKHKYDSFDGDEDTAEPHTYSEILEAHHRSDPQSFPGDSVLAALAWAENFGIQVPPPNVKKKRKKRPRRAVDDDARDEPSHNDESSPSSDTW